MQGIFKTYTVYVHFDLWTGDVEVNQFIALANQLKLVILLN